MHSSNPAFITALAPKADTAFDDLAAALGDQRPQASEEALVQLGRALMTELLDVIADTALEDFQMGAVCEGLIRCGRWRRRCSEICEKGLRAR